MLSSYSDLLLRRTERQRGVLLAVAFWTLAGLVLVNLRELHLWGLPGVELMAARATMMCCLIVAGLAGIQCIGSRREPVWSISFWRQSIGTPVLFLFASVASYLAIGAIVLVVEGNWQPDTGRELRYRVLCLGVFIAVALGSRAVLERAGADRLLRGALVVLIASCVVIVASPLLRDLGILPPYRLPFRLTGAFANPNDAAIVACMTVVLALAFLSNGGPRGLAYPGLAMGTAATLATASRTGFLVIVAMLALFALLNLRDKRKIAFFLSWAAGLIGVAVVAVQITPWGWLRTAEDGQPASGLFCESSLGGHSGMEADCAVLLAVKDVLAGDITLNWSRLRPVREWEGVTLNKSGELVAELTLRERALNGRIPPELGRLHGLVALDLAKNRLVGPIPPELGNLRRLTYLGLPFNLLTGAIPPELGKLPSLEQLWLQGNRLTGPIPPQLGEIGSLWRLRVAGNDLDLPFPSGLYELRDQDLANGLFCRQSSRTSPELLGDCTLLLATRDELADQATLNWHRDVSLNAWRGVVLGGPDLRVKALYLAESGLTGRIPPELGRLHGLERLDLSRNRLTGRIPPELGNLASLRYLGLAFNRLVGTIPPELARLSSLEELWLRHNRLTGPVPPQLGEAGSLWNLRLAGNDLDRPFPPELYELPSQDLARDLFCRRSSRTSPELLGDCTLLLEMRDELAGRATLNWHAGVPIGRWQGVTLGGPKGRVKALDLSGQGLTGRIPPELGRLHGLASLHLARNRLIGPVPPELGQLANLRELSLDGNAPTGVLPPGLYRLPDHDFTDDLFCRGSSRTRPELLGDCTLLLEMRDELAGRATLNWRRDIPIGGWRGVTLGGPEGRVIALELPRMGLNGRLPVALGRLERLRILTLDGNWLTGPIPRELEDLADLQVLALAGNDLDRPFPPGLYRLPDHDFTDDLFCRGSSRTRPELLDDCTLLLEMRDELAGRATLNWRRGIPIGGWRGVTLGGPEGRVIALELPRMGLNGRIPAALGSLDRLRSLVLDGNGLTGSIPPELGNLADLRVLALAANDLTGSVPPELARLPSLDEVWLSDNRLTDPASSGLGPVGGQAPFCPAVSSDNPGLRADCALLLGVKGTLAGNARLNWSLGLPLAGWHGVTVGGPLERVTRLELPKWNLNGRIPPELGRLGHLVSLDLSGNRLVGGIPPALGELHRLVALRLDRNRLTGPIPPEFGKLQRLRELQLQKNDLTDPVPPQLVEIGSLSLLRLVGNDLDRPFPSRLHEIDDHDLHVFPPLRGDAPGKVGGREAEGDPVCRPSPETPSALLADCTLLLAIRDVLAGEARLNWSEHLPVRFWQGVSTGGSPRRVTALELPRAGLNGRLAPELGALGGLVALDLRRNRLAGSVPSALGGLERLVSLRLEHNELTGPVPPELGAIEGLSFLRLSGNDLARPFPPTLHAIGSHDLDTAIRCRSGRNGSDLLADCALLLAVKDALAGDARLNWSPDVPLEDWQGVTADPLRGRVTALDLTQLGLNGRLPPELGRLEGLVSLRLSRNRLVGSVPPEFGSLANLRELWLDDNRLGGPIPPELGRLSRLEDLQLEKNVLSGPLPPSVAALPGLAAGVPDDGASTGNRDGTVDKSPRCQAAATRLYDDCATLLQVRDRLAGDAGLNWSATVPIDHWRGVTLGLPPAAIGATATAPRIVALDLSHMGLNGSIPAELSALDALAVLHLGDNRLEGSIPPELGALAGLRALTLENNALTGTIPEEIGALRRLVWLRLGGNGLTGPIPRQIASLADLRVLSLEDNALTGFVPWWLDELRQLETLRLDNNRLHGRNHHRHGDTLSRLAGLPRLRILRLDADEIIGCIPMTWHAAQARYDNVEPDLLCRPPPWRKPGVLEDVAHLMLARDVLAGGEALNWSYARPVGSWQGVILEQGRVAGLNLSNMNLNGRLPPELGNLAKLSTLRLDGNRLTGSIPPELGKLNKLVALSLVGNNLTGPIPPEFGDLLNLHLLWLDDNPLDRAIPPGLLAIDGLSLRVAGNDVHGAGAFGTDRSIGGALANQRLLLWRLGFEKAMEAPLFGHGLGALQSLDFAPPGYDGKPLGVHNLYLTLLGEAGIIPLSLFLLSVFLLLRSQWLAPKSLSRDAAAGWVVAIILFGMTRQHLLAIAAFMFMTGLSTMVSRETHGAGRFGIARA